MNFLRRSLTGLLVVALTIGLLSLAGQTIYSAISASMADEGGARPGRERVYAVSVMTVTPETVTPVIETFGEIQSRRTLELRATAAGELVWLSDAFEEGAAVAQGDVLARLDDRDVVGWRDTAAADLAEAEADLRDAVRSLDLAQAEVVAAETQAALRVRSLERQRELLGVGVGTDSDVEDAEIAASSAEQSVLSMRKSLAAAEARVDMAEITRERRRIALAEAERRVVDTEIRAEFSGRLSNVSVVEGRLVNANEALGEIVDPDALEASFRVSTAQYARLLDEDGELRSADVQVLLDVGDLDLIATGRLTRESPAVGEGQTGRLLFAALDAPAGFRPGDFVTIRISEAPLDHVATLPSSALDSASTVLALGDEDRLETLDAPLLRRQGDAVIVDASALVGRTIVAERSPFLGTGIKVRPIRPGGDAGSETEAEAPPADELVKLDEDRRARLVAFVENNRRMPADAKERVLAQLRQDRVPVQVVNRIESRMGG